MFFFFTFPPTNETYTSGHTLAPHDALPCFEARERNPRSRTARFLLLEHYVRNGQAKEAAGEMAVLTRLMPDARPLLIAGLARFAESTPESRSEEHTSALQSLMRNSYAVFC